MKKGNYAYLSPEQHAQRLILYHQGLKDPEIAAKVGVTSKNISYWRRKNNLPPNVNYSPDRRSGVPMTEALTPDQCQVMRQFFADLLNVADYGKKVDIGTFMSIWRKVRYERAGA